MYQMLYQKEMVEFKPKFHKRIYIALLFFGLVLPMILVKVIKDPLGDPMLTVSAIVIFYGMIYIILFRFIKKIVLQDDQAKMIISYHLIPKKTIQYHEIKELGLHALVTSKGKIYFHMMTNADQFLKLLEQREKDKLISYNGDLELSETSKYFLQIKAIKLSLFILPVVIFVFYFSGLDFGKYNELFFFLTLFFTGFIIYKLSIKQASNKRLGKD
jgi:hypothetical protein